MAESLGGAIRAWDDNAAPPAAGNLGAALAAALTTEKNATLLDAAIPNGKKNEIVVNVMIHSSLE